MARYFSLLLFTIALLAAFYYNGRLSHLFSLSWLALLVWAFVPLVQNTLIHRPQANLLFIAGIGLTIWLFITYLLGDVPWYNAAYSWRLGVLPFVFLVAVTLFTTDGLKRHIDLLIACGLALALFTIWQALNGLPPDGGMYNRNNNAALLNLLLFAIAARFLTAPKSDGTMLWGLAFTVMVYASLLPGSRGSVLGLLFGLGLLLLLSRGLGCGRRLLGLTSLTLLAFLANYLLAGAVLQEMPSAYALDSNQDRVQIWQATVNMLADAPWYGIGAGVYWLLYPAYRFDSEISAGYFVHNDYLQFLLEIGYPGLLFVLLIAVGLILAAVSLSKSNAASTKNRLLGSSLIAGITAVAVHSMVTFNFYISPILIVLGLYLGQIYHLTTPGMVNIRLERPRLIILSLALALPFPYFLGLGSAYLSLHDLAGNSVNMEMVEQTRRLDLAMRLDRTADIYPLTQAIHLRTVIGLTHDQSQQSFLFNEADALFSRARALNPYRASNYHEHAKLLLEYPQLAGSDAHGKAMELASTAVSINPRNYQARMTHARLYEDQGNKTKALEQLLAGLYQRYTVDGGLAYYYAYGERLADELGDTDAQQLFLERMAANNIIPARSELSVDLYD